MVILFQIESVLDERNTGDWSKLIRIKSFSGSNSIFGSFEFECFEDVLDVSHAQKEKRVCRRKDSIVENRPTTVTETSANESASSKVEIVFNTIKQVKKNF